MNDFTALETGPLEEHVNARLHHVSLSCSIEPMTECVSPSCVIPTPFDSLRKLACISMVRGR